MQDEEHITQSRRNLVTGLGGVGLAAALLAAPRTAQASGVGTAISGFYDVTQTPYNADNTGATDAQPGIQKAITAAQANGGGVVWIPPGIYKLASGLVISAQVELCGAGWSSPDPDTTGHPNNSAGSGSWFYIESIAFTPLRVALKTSATIKNIAFVHKQPTDVTGAWVPMNYPFAIEINGRDVLVENVFLRNATRGIAIKGQTSANTTGRIHLKNISGQPLITGISVDNAWDAVKIDDVHFWNYWSYYQSVIDYTRYGNCNAFLFAKADIPYLSNIFVINYRRGFYFTSSGGTAGGITSAFLMNNCAADGCASGIEVDGAGTTGSITGFYALGGTNAVCGIATGANNVVLQCSNIRLRIYNTSCFYIGGVGTVVTIENVWCDSWNQANLGFPAIAAIDGASVIVGRSRIFTGSTGPQFLTAGSPVGTITQDS